MYASLNGITVTVSTFGAGSDSTSTIIFHGQDDIQVVLNGLGTEIRLYEDQEMTKLAAIYNQVEVQRASVDLVQHNVSVTISASRISELETEQMKKDIETQQNALTDSDGALVELANLIEENADAIAELATIVDELKAEIDELKPKTEEEA